MLLLAMAPPDPIGVKLVVAFLMLAFSGMLMRAIRGGPLTKGSIRLAAGTTLLAVIVLEIVLPSSYGGGFHDRSVLAAIVGALSGALVLRPARPGLNGRHWASRTLQLAVLTLISGPLLGLLIALLLVRLTNIPPIDHAHTFRVFITIGSLAGLIGAVIVTVVALVSFGWSRSS